MFGLGILLGYMFGRVDEEEKKSEENLKKTLSAISYDKYQREYEKKQYKKSLKKFVIEDKFILENGKKLLVDYGIGYMILFGTSIPVMMRRDYHLFYDQNIIEINYENLKLHINDIVQNNCINFSKKVYDNLNNKEQIKILEELNGLKITEHKEAIESFGPKVMFGIPLRMAKYVEDNDEEI